MHAAELEQVVVVAVVAPQMEPMAASVAEPVVQVLVVLTDYYLLHWLSQTPMPHQDLVPRHLFELEQLPEPKYLICSSKVNMGSFFGDRIGDKTR